MADYYKLIANKERLSTQTKHLSGRVVDVIESDDKVSQIIDPDDGSKHKMASRNLFPVDNIIQIDRVSYNALIDIAKVARNLVRNYEIDDFTKELLNHHLKRLMI